MAINKTKLAEEINARVKSQVKKIEKKIDKEVAAGYVLGEKVAVHLESDYIDPNVLAEIERLYTAEEWKVDIKNDQREGVIIYLS